MINDCRDAELHGFTLELLVKHQEVHMIILALYWIERDGETNHTEAFNGLVQEEKTFVFFSGNDEL